MIGELLFRATQLLRKSNAHREYLRIADVPFRSRAEIDALQLTAAREIVRQAALHVPYYRRRYADAGIDAREIRSWQDFAAIPVLTKDDIRANVDDMVDERVDRATLIAHNSGGSTGVPLRFYRTRDYLDASDAGTFRNLAQCGWRPGDMIAFVWGFNERLEQMAAWEFEARQLLRRQYQFDPFRSSAEDFDRWIRTWRRIRPKVVLGYASTIARFADHLNSRGTALPGIRGVFTTAEKLYPVQRAQIEQAFGAKAFDLYGSSEIQNIAAECPLGRMHINADYTVVETAERDLTRSHAAPPLLLTSLKSTAMPFIRYRNEDTGSLSAETCGCGRGFPLMNLDIARVSDNFRLPGGRVVHGEFFTHLMYGTAGVASFQFHQVRENRIALYLVPTSADQTLDAVIAKVTSEIAALTREPVELVASIVDHIPLSAAGKHRFTRSDIAADAAVAAL